MAEKKSKSTEKSTEKSTAEVASQGVSYGTGNVELTFINQSNDMNNSSVVIFQKNVATDYEEVAVAWRVIRNCGRGWSHKFNYPFDFYVGAGDSYGNLAPQLSAEYGQKWDVVRTASGDTLQLDSTPASSMNEVEIKNSLMTGSIDAQIYKDGKLLLTKTGVSPAQKAVFSFKPTIWVGVASQIEEGEIMNSAILSDINTEISLLGITKANLIMTGGGVGPTATPFQFHLEPTA